ncbi:MAG TPA: helix-hairpin-helix domain-containing protein [Pyrinomonadaceae bacterium]|nr:helix-hairpin-helix domain-containing protein [Pyrinomonadaceae bacterium]
MVKVAGINALQIVIDAHTMRRTRFLPFVFLCYMVVFACVSSCVKLPRRAGVVSGLTTNGLTHAPLAQTTALVNINTASREELERLPGIGEGLAARIVEHRERHGAFRRVEHLIIVRGISERRFSALRAHVTVH